MGKEKISIITVTYNCEASVEKTINSVLLQDYDNIEYIIIDGASKDGTNVVIEHYKNRLSYYVSEPDQGVYDAMNKGISVATGDWIMFMNSGDSFYDKSVVSSIEWEKYRNSGVVFGDYVNTSEPLTVVRCITPFMQRKWPFVTMGFHHQSSFVRADLAKRLKFDLSFKLCADYNMIWRIYKEGYSIDRSDVVVALVDNEVGLSASNRLLQIYEQGRACEQEKTFAFRCYYSYKVLRNKLKNIFRVK